VQTRDRRVRQPVTFRWLAFLLGAFFLISACRLADVMVPFSSNAPTPVAQAYPTKTHTPAQALVGAKVGTELPTETQAPTETAAPTETVAPTETTAPTETAAPTEPPRLTAPAQPAARPIPTETQAPTETPEPTRAFLLLVSNAWCGPNWQTYVEGTVTEGGSPVDGLRVRISQNYDGGPAWQDYVTGTDPTKPGGYTQVIGANRPVGGLWYVWVVDPKTNKRISDIATVKTDPQRIEDTDTSPGSCQSATVDFSDEPAPEQVPSDTPEPTDTSEVTETPTATGTAATATPTGTGTVTGTPATGTPTGTGTVTGTATDTPTFTRTPKSTRTFTPTPTRTLTPTTNPVP
jgi:hypothetical protein